VSSCRTFVRSTLSAYSREISAHGFEVAVGSSGTIQAVAAIAQAATGADPPKTFNRYRLTADDVRAVAKAAAGAASVKQRSRIAGLDADRADIILAGALILEGVVETFRIEELEVSDYALREGVLLDTLQRTRGGSLHHLRDVSRRSVRHLAEMCDEEPEHSAHVARLALDIFDGLVGTGSLDGVDELGEPAREYLEAGALLANVGLFISHSQHHQHSYYVIRNSEVLTGFTNDEIEIIALLARYHRKSTPKLRHPEYARLSEDEQRLVRTLAAILRVAIGLDRSHARKVHGVGVARRGEHIVLELLSAPGAELGLERYSADQRKDLLVEVLGRPVELTEHRHAE
jgi:exopolyphosphatase/guanosine-5'-triphosphate,3'-diphosphate pyrophosphatase